MYIFHYLKYSNCGFTLAELLICLLILGEIATFTVPKIIIASSNGNRDSIMKEAAATVSGAYQLAWNNGQINGSSRLADLTPYLNYVAIDTSTIIDDGLNFTSLTCSASNPCYRLHSGALLMDRCSLGGTGTTSGMVLPVDTDGSYSGTTTGDGKSVLLILFYNGRVTSMNKAGNVLNGCGTYTPNPDPTWAIW
jgi:prepilin-type N-terminal cleavage/methylation domain-containing protein